MGPGAEGCGPHGGGRASQFSYPKHYRNVRLESGMEAGLHSACQEFFLRGQCENIAVFETGDDTVFAFWKEYFVLCIMD